MRRRSRPMTVTAGHAPAGRTAPALPPAGGSGIAEAPRLAEGVELLGEYQDSGYSQPPFPWWAASWPWTAGCSPPTGWAGAPAGAARPGGPADRAWPVRDLRRVPRVRARGRLPLRRRAARGDRCRHLPDLAVVLHQR